MSDVMRFSFQGLTLARPEIVPFRLTPSMVDGMGLCGFEGVYRRVMETCMSVLRTNRETLLSVLEPFLQARTGQEKEGEKQTGWRRQSGPLGRGVYIACIRDTMLLLTFCSTLEGEKFGSFPHHRTNSVAHLLSGLDTPPPTI